MAPGACGCWLANQCESTFGTSFAQTSLLSAHLGCCQTPSLSVQFPTKRATPQAEVLRAHTPARHFPKPSQSSWHLGRPSPLYLPACSTSTLEDQRAPGSQHYHSENCPKESGSWHRCAPSRPCNGTPSLWSPSQTGGDAIVEFPSLCFCYPVPVHGSILALDSTEHTCCGERRAREHLLWSVAVGKLFHFDKMACGNTMA